MIEDHQITASSWAEGHLPQHARLNGNSSWIPHPHDSTPWIQFEFEERMVITGVVVQGGGSRDDLWVEWFYLYYSYSPDGVPMHAYMKHDYYQNDIKVSPLPHSPPPHPTKLKGNRDGRVGEGAVVFV